MTSYKKCARCGALVSEDATACRMCRKLSDRGPGKFVAPGTPVAIAPFMIFLGLAVAGIVVFVFLRR